MTKHIFWFGDKIGELMIDGNAEIYRTVEDVINETNRVSYKMMDIESFSLKYLRHISRNGIQFTGWLWDGARPEKRATRESLNACEIRDEGVSLIDRNGVVYDIDVYSKFYQTREKCARANTSTIIMLDEDNGVEKERRDKFYKYVKHCCPGFEDKIEWERFNPEKSMSWNLSDQVMNFIKNKVV